MFVEYVFEVHLFQKGSWLSIQVYAGKYHKTSPVNVYILHIVSHDAILGSAISMAMALVKWIYGSNQAQPRLEWYNKQQESL